MKKSETHKSAEAPMVTAPKRATILRENVLSSPRPVRALALGEIAEFTAHFAADLVEALARDLCRIDYAYSCNVGSIVELDVYGLVWCRSGR